MVDAQALLAIKEQIARPIAAVVVLNNIFNIVGSIAVGRVAVAVFGVGWVGVVSGVLIRPLTRGDRGPSTNEAEIRLLAGIGRSRSNTICWPRSSKGPTRPLAGTRDPSRPCHGSPVPTIFCSSSGAVVNIWSW